MNKIIQSSVLAILVSAGFGMHAFAYTQLTSQLDFGDRGFNVTNLQTFFADNASIYPEAMVTGYFGTLTRGATMRFQAAYGIDQAGRVGPVTLAKINSLIANGGWTTTDSTGPAFSNVVYTTTGNSISFTFNTSENTSTRVVYDTTMVRFNEGDLNSNGFSAIGGNTVSDGGMSTSHSVSATNLQPNTTYYYTVIATDAAGNVSVFGPNNSIRTK